MTGWSRCLGSSGSQKIKGVTPRDFRPWATAVGNACVGPTQSLQTEDMAGWCPPIDAVNASSEPRSVLSLRLTPRAICLGSWADAGVVDVTATNIGSDTRAASSKPPWRARIGRTMSPLTIGPRMGGQNDYGRLATQGIRPARAHVLSRVVTIELAARGCYGMTRKASMSTRSTPADPFLATFTEIVWCPGLRLAENTTWPGLRLAALSFTARALLPSMLTLALPRSGPSVLTRATLRPVKPNTALDPLCADQ